MVQRSTPSPKQASPPVGLAGLSQRIAPGVVRISYVGHNALPYRLEWSSGAHTAFVYGLTPDEAATEALAAIERGEWHESAHVTAAADQGEFVEALRDWADSESGGHAHGLRLVHNSDRPNS